MISVVMPCYNCETSLVRTAECIRAQTVADWELIAVDDGSSDGTGAALDALARADARIRVIHQENGGPSRARNTGIAHAQGKYLSAICAAPSIFGHKGLLKGRTACCFPDFESHLEGAVVTKNPVEVCDHFITSRGMGTAIEFALAILARMQDQACADDIAEKIVYKH